MIPFGSRVRSLRGVVAHTGTVVEHTSDGFYRISWDKPNPRPDIYNLERVFSSGELEVV